LPSQGRYAATRVISAAALVGALVLVTLLVLGGGERRYEVRVLLENAGQLVRGNQVKVGGKTVGEVREIRLTDDNQAELRLRIEAEDLQPLHRGTKAIVRSTSLSGIANRYVALVPGPNNAPTIADGGTIPAQDTRPAVDLDQVINTVDQETRDALQQLVHGSSLQYRGVEGQANRGLRALNPAVSQVAATARELNRDQAAFERFIVQSAAVVSAVAPRSAELEQGIANAAAATQAVATRRADLDATLALAPRVLRRANTTLVNLRATLVDIRPALREARPVAPRLARTLDQLRPVVARARPAVADLRGLVADALPALRGLPPLNRVAGPTFSSASRALGDALPIVSAARPYLPDVVAGLLNGFGGTTGGYYDANGHYARISFQGGPFSLNNAGSLVPVPPSEGTLSGYRRGIVARCPGAATQPAPDRSNPFLAPEAPCNPAETP
jgi:phospholipid/cholesterol/gamma-HCH transport system substrate-binding protein